MTTTHATQKKNAKSSAKTPAAFASTRGATTPSKKNPSKFEPTNEARLDIQSLGDSDGVLKFFTESVRGLYWAEKQLVKSLPKMAKAASSKELSAAIQKHLGQTKTHVERVEQVFGLLNMAPQSRKCDAMEGLIKEGEGVLEDTDEGTAARDLGIIMASQKVEHYEMAAYQGLAKLAEKLNLPEIAELLSVTLTEEEDTNEILGILADKKIRIAKKA
jgi:ferritin-like metal-binding protein YciE